MTALTSQMQQLVVEHLPIVGYHVNETLMRVPGTVFRDDLASAGALALVQAAQSYDASTGVPFNRYAALRIRGALIDELRSMDWATRGARQKARRMQSLTDELTAQLARTPTRAELASAMGGVEEVDAARASADRRLLSLEGFDNAIADQVSDDGPGPEEMLLAGESLTYLRAAVAELPDRLRHVVEQIFLHDRPVVELAAELGVTQSRISQLRSEALVLLRDGVNSQLDPTLVQPSERPDGVAERRRRTYFEAVAQRAALSARSAGIAAESALIPTQRPHGGTKATLPHQRGAAAARARDSIAG